MISNGIQDHWSISGGKVYVYYVGKPVEGEHTLRIACPDKAAIL